MASGRNSLSDKWGNTMNKALGTVLALILILIVICSCEDSPDSSGVSGPDEVVVTGISASLSRTYQISGNTQVRMTGLVTDGLYGIYPSDSTRSVDNTFSRDVVNLTATATGTYLHLSVGDDLIFSGRDVGIRGQGGVRMIRFTPINGNGEMVIDTNDITTGYIGDNDLGQRMFEKYFLVDLDSLGIDKSDVALMKVREGSARNLNTDHGIVSERGIGSSQDPALNGVMDLSAYSTIGIFQMAHIGSGWKREGLVLTNPVKLEMGMKMVLSSPSVVRIPASDKELVIELSDFRNDLGFTSLSLKDSTVDGRIATGRRAGMHAPYIFPISCTSDENGADTVLLYVGTLEEDVIFDFQNGEITGEICTATLREITPEEKNLITFFDICEEIPLEITLPGIESGYRAVYPVVFRSEDADDLIGVDLEAEFSDPETDILVHLLYGAIDDKGFSQGGLEVEFPTYEGYNNRRLEYFYIVYKAKDVGQKVTISFSK